MLNKEQKKHLRTLAHNLDIVIWTGQHGLTENVMAEINTALDHHELIKIKI
ncbi:MAG: putative RNA binding protein, partial [Gammaproteobacteria bacterium]|nr:putative RNA binding protein [Gammaproteobacteria bacterium]